MLEAAVQPAAEESKRMPAKVPPTSNARQRLLQSFSKLPAKDKQMLRTATGHLRWLTILWGLDELDPDSGPAVAEKRHILLAYKLLQLVWFTKLPDNDRQAFTLYVRDQVPEEQGPASINRAFDRSPAELADLCVGLQRPKWVKNIPAVLTSLESFPQRAH